MLLDAPPAGVARLVQDHTDAWVGLLPELGPLVVPEGRPAGSPELQRRRAYDGVAAVLRRLAQRAPVLLAVDDLQDGGAATVDLLGYLAERLRDTPVLVVGAIRSEDAGLVSVLADRATGRAARRAAPVGGGRPGRSGGPRDARRDGHGTHRRSSAQRRRVPARPGRG